jgi:hypothetical protein
MGRSSSLWNGFGLESKLTLYGFSLTSYNGVKVSKIFVHTPSFWEFYPVDSHVDGSDSVMGWSDSDDEPPPLSPVVSFLASMNCDVSVVYRPRNYVR